MLRGPLDLPRGRFPGVFEMWSIAIQHRMTSLQIIDQGQQVVFNTTSRVTETTAGPVVSRQYPYHFAGAPAASSGAIDTELATSEKRSLAEFLQSHLNQHRHDGWRGSTKIAGCAHVSSGLLKIAIGPFAISCHG